MHHPFAELIGLDVLSLEAGASRCAIAVGPQHMNPYGVVNGAVVYALADTGMGAALFPTLGANESCATIDIKINYFKPVRAGRLACETTLVNRVRSVANLEARIFNDGTLVASANGNFAIFSTRQA